MFARVHLDAIQLGIAEELEKYAASGSSYFDSNAPSMFPTLTGQARWKYARTKDGLKLHDGAQSYHFKGLPEDYPHEDTRVHWQEPTPHFEEGAISTGTAQIHRSSPDNLYVTLADGGLNPTFMLQHEQDKQWRYSPSKKFSEKLKAQQVGTAMPQPPQVPKISPHHDTEDNKAGGNAQILSIPDFQEGVKHASIYNPWTHGGHGYDAEGLRDKLVSLYDILSNGFNSAVNMGANHPIATALGTAAAVRGYQMLRDARDPNRIEERSQDPHKRNLHALYPIAAGIGHTALSSARAVPNQGGQGE